MKKYIEVFKMNIKDQMAYRFDTINGALMSFIWVFMAFLLWRVIYENKEVVGGYTFSMMLTYYIIISLIQRLSKTEFMVWEMSDDIRNGRFTKYITRPIHPIKYYISACYARTVFVLGINALAFVVWAVGFKKYFILQTDPYILLSMLAFIVMGMFIMIQTHYFIATLAFKTMEVGGLYHMFLNIVDFFAGALIPLSLLPGGLVEIMRFFPFYYTLYFPASIYLGERVSEIPSALIICSIWTVVMYIINQFTYQRLYKSYEGVGA